MFEGTSSYLSNSIVKVPLPSVNDLKEVEYPNISDNGTLAVITFMVPLSSDCSICPLFEEMSPITSPKKSGGTNTSKDIIGSNNINPPLRAAPPKNQENPPPKTKKKKD